MALKIIDSLKIIILLDSICLGVTYPFLSRYIQSLGADHIAVGVLTVGYFLCNSIVADLIMPLFEPHSKKFKIFILCLVTMISHLALILTDNYWYIIFARCVFSTARGLSQNLYERLLTQQASSYQHEYFEMCYRVLNGAGYIIGPIIAGYLYDDRFVNIILLAASLSLLNTCLALTIRNNAYVNREWSSDPVGKTLSDVYQNLNNVSKDFIKCFHEKNWDIMAVKFLHVSCITIFYSKFTQILNYNFQSSPITVGYTFAYMNTLTFASTIFTIIIFTEETPVLPSPIILTGYSLKLLCICLFMACYVPFYSMYMIMCVPIIFINTILNSTWTDLFATRKNDCLLGLIEPLTIAANLLTPMFFGVLCNGIGHHAVIIFSVIPIVFSIFITSQYRMDKLEQVDEKNKQIKLE